MKRDAKGAARQTVSEYADELRPWGRLSEAHIGEAVKYTLDRGTILPDEAERETESNAMKK